MPYSEVAEVQEMLLGDNKDVFEPSTVVANRRTSTLTPGKMSQGQGKEVYPTQPQICISRLLVQRELIARVLKEERKTLLKIKMILLLICQNEV